MIKYAPLLLVITLLLLYAVRPGSRHDEYEISPSSTIRVNCSPSPFPIDAVYTWVNGTDADFISQLAHQAKGGSNTAEDTSASRFRDFNQLLYSLRSIDTYAPWIRHVYIVTNGQRPVWLNLTSSVTIVPHETIFVDREHLPTFNSRAIESHLHRIPGLSENFLYFNDDWAFTSHVCPDDFWTQSTGYKLRVGSLLYSFLTRNLMALFTPTCSSTCRSKRHNGQCDPACNEQKCMFDGNECVPPKSNKASFFDALDFTGALFNDRMGYAYRWRTEHIPLLINKRIMIDLQMQFEEYFTATSSHHTRQRNDIQFEFAYINWLVEAPNSRLRSKIYPWLYKSTVVGVDDFAYIAYGGDNIRKNRQKLVKTLARRSRLKFICINDLIDYTRADIAEWLNVISDFYLKLFPHRSQFELYTAVTK